MKKPRFVFIVGGVMSGLGKGVFTASLSKLLQWKGLKVNPIKIDPYLNVDAGTMRPTEHGEVWVTYDGGEIDQDLGTYERFLHLKISKNNNITSGKIFWEVINAERKGKFLGKTVQYIPHIVNYIEKKLVSAHKTSGADLTVVEVGGTVGDFESELFFHTISTMVSKYPVGVIFMGYLVLPPHIGELKTKPFQHSLAHLFRFGIKPDALVLRSPVEVDEVRKEKLSAISGISKEKMIELPDVSNIYRIPLVVYNQRNALKSMFTKLGVTTRIRSSKVQEYKNFVDTSEKLQKKGPFIKVAMVGKYFASGNFTLLDSYISVLESIKYAAWSLGYGVKIIWVDSTKISQKDSDKKVKSMLQDAQAIIVPGGFGSTGVEGKLRVIRYARENRVPYLGLCYGLQLAVVEYARNVAGLKEANTTEIDANTPHPVVDILPEQKDIIKRSRYGASMRLGEYKAYLKKPSIVYKVYKKAGRVFKDANGEYVVERHRHRYEVNPQYHKVLQDAGLVFSGLSVDGRLVEFIELPEQKHPYFVGTQAHPEFTSYPLDPNPLFVGLLEAGKGR